MLKHRHAAAGTCFTARNAPPTRCIPFRRQQQQQQHRSGVSCQAAELLVGVGSSVPETYLTNHDLEKLVDTTDDWITSRTGIKKRHVLGKGETLAQHAAVSAKRALEMAGMEAKDIDLILFATSSPDDVFGSACQVSPITLARGPESKR